MKFSIDYSVSLGDQQLDSAAVFANINSHRDALSDIGSVEGALVLRSDSDILPGTYSEPLVRLVHLWLSKVAWVVGGDTETVALRNSAECYAFVPTGEGVEVSFYAGDESEIEEYVLEPTIVRLDHFAEESIRLGESVMKLIREVDASALENNEDCRDLRTSLDEAKQAWKNYQLHQRR